MDRFLGELRQIVCTHGGRLGVKSHACVVISGVGAKTGGTRQDLSLLQPALLEESRGFTVC